LCADGLADRRVMCTMADPHAAGIFGDCLFVIAPQHSYDAARSLEKFAAIAEAAPSGMEGSDAAAAMALRLRALREAAEAEAASNAATEANLNGTPVFYGQSVQLRHVKSSKLLAMITKSVAHLETACTLVALRTNASVAGLFTIRPRFKLRQLGDRVCVGDCAVFMAAKTGLHLHVSSGGFDAAGTYREVNGSTVARAGLRIVLYSDYMATASTNNVVMGGDLVR
jgi:Inositol 1,4,5-trisphosphate/ryanodine receptor